MSIIEPNKDQLNEFIFKNNSSFLQSWQWGDLQAKMKRPVRRFFILEEGQPVMSATFIRHDLLLGKYYWLCPKGPVFAKAVILEPRAVSRGDRISGILRDSIASLQNDRNCIFLRVEPEITFNFPLSTFDLRKAPKDHNPRATILIDLSQTENELLNKMHPKTRYNIKLAEKKNVKVESGIMNQELWKLFEETARRDKFHLHPKQYYEELLKMEEIKLFGAYHEDRLVAAALVSFWGETATYLHGASEYRERSLMAPYLLHWEIIRQARREGLQYYDFGGVAPKSEAKHPLAGVGRFKAGFGGEYREYIGSWDYVINRMWYRIYKFARRIL